MEAHRLDGPVDLVAAVGVLVALALVGLGTVAARARPLGLVGLLLRMALPSWRFFDRAGDTPELWVAVVDEDEHVGPWRRALPPRPLGAWTTLWNPRGNLLLAAHALLDALVDDLAERGAVDADAVEALPRYAQVAALVPALTPPEHLGARVRLRLTLRATGEDGAPSEELVFTSPARALESLR